MLQDFSKLQKNDIYHFVQYLSFLYLCWRNLVLRQRLHFCLRRKGRLLRSKRATRLETSKYVIPVDKRFNYLPITLFFRLTDAGLRSLQGALDAVRGSSQEALMLSRLVVCLPGVETGDIVQSVDKWFFFMEGCESCVASRCNSLHSVFKGMCGHLCAQRSGQYIFLKSPP